MTPHSPQSSTRIRWLLIGWLFVLSAVAFLDRVNLSIAGTRLAADYHLSDVQFGLLSTVFLLGYALLQTPAGWLADRWGPRRVLAGGVICGAFSPPSPPPCPPACRIRSCFSCWRASF